MVQRVFAFLACYIIYMYGSGCVGISYVLYNICMALGVIVFLMCYIMDMYGSGPVCISNV